ncbi:MAG: DUF1295 domain-containing protein [Chitinophagales bacterium]|nr:DUF1295 domain-containing protein [Chitinophagales bacterium]HRX22719.1 DUF1295 domain-containing protein [Chitinophagales bacterium]
MNNKAFPVWQVAVLLLAAVLIIPALVVSVQQPLAPLQLSMLRESGMAMAALAVLCFMVSSLTGNHSQVDKLWSIVPMGYVWYFAWMNNMEDRSVLMAVMVTIWGFRLTYNFARRGGYSWKFWTGEEDYRWSLLRKSPAFNATWRWVLFNLLFISLYQMTLIWLFCLPAVAVAGMDTKLTMVDWLLATAMFLAILLETIADQQQWNFQRKKLSQANTVETAKGFLDTGLWSYVRHPNYTAEQSVWILFYGFSIVATEQWINWSVIGCILLLMLFQGSARFSEGISAGKYPDYHQYMQQTSRFIPLRIKR